MLRLFAFIVALGLMGCSSSPPATPAQSDAQTSSTAVSGGDVGALLNAARARNGLPPLARSRQLTAAAEVHARDMARNRFFSHTGSDRSSVGQRVQRQGYGFCFVAENIAQGQKFQGLGIRHRPGFGGYLGAGVWPFGVLRG